MPLVAAYHRPQTLAEALALLAEPDTVPLAGGTIINADRAHSRTEVVDLQSLGLDGIYTDGGAMDGGDMDGGAISDGRLRLGATTTLSAMATSDAVPDWLRTIVRAEAPSTLRSLATIGGTVAARSWESLLLAALLACNGRLEVATVGGEVVVPLVEVVSDGLDSGAIITAVTIDAGGRAAHAVTARTPADVPIVAAVARAAATQGTPGIPTLALSGVATTPVLVADPHDPTAGLDPPGDFRGSADYRRHLAAVLSDRVLGELSEVRS